MGRSCDQSRDREIKIEVTQMKHLILSSLILAVSLDAAEPIRQASEARFWLKVPANQPPLSDVRVSHGSATPASWEKDPAVRERHTDVIFPVHWWSWEETIIQFTPAYDGPLELVLNGPWAADKDGGIFRQEILWDTISADGTDLKNGGFESMTDKQPDSWQSPWAPYLALDTWPIRDTVPLEGKHIAATWHNRPLAQTLTVRTGRKVSIRLHAKAATPPDFIAPKVLGSTTPAHSALARLKRGVNLGNGWEADPSWMLRFTTQDIDHIADQGFDHIRVPVAFHRHLKEGASGLELSPALVAELEPVLRHALDRKLGVLLDWHHFDDLTKDPQKNLDRFVAGWECIARHFKSWPPGLFLELLNEPNNALTTEVANPIYQKTISAIHRVDATRIIVLSPGAWGGIRELDKLRLPDNDDRIIVTVHCYEPFHFTHQGAGWVGFQNLKGVTYPGPPKEPLQIPASLKDNSGVCSFITAYNSLPAGQNPCSSRPVREMLDTARAWSQHFGRPVHLGEFGAHNIGDVASRGRYLHDVRTLAEARGIPWTMWEWKASFGYWDPEKNKPRFRKELIE